MTSEGLQHPGREPDDAVPGAAGPAPQHGSYPPETEDRFAARPGGTPPGADPGWPPASGYPDGSPGWGAPPGSPPPTGAEGRPWGPAARPEPVAWGPPENAPPVRAAASPWAPQESTPPARPEQPGPAAGGSDFPPEWGNPPATPPPATPPRWPGAESGGGLPAHPAVPEGTPWPAEQAWGSAEPPSRAPQDAPPSAGFPPGGTDVPIYQPAPAPGISPAKAVPLPPQETRVPGASLAAAPPADYPPPADAYGPPAGYAAPAYGGSDAGHDGPAGWSPSTYPPAPREEQQPGSMGGAPVVPPTVPQQRSPSESAVAGRVSIPRPETQGAPPAAGEPPAGTAGKGISASASVPLASRVLPPADQSIPPAAIPSPRPRVYGRAAGAEQPAEPDQRAAEPEPRNEAGPSRGPVTYGEVTGPAPDPYGAGAARATPPGAPPPPAFPAYPPASPQFTGAGAAPFGDRVEPDRPVNGTHLGGAARPGDSARFDAPPGSSYDRAQSGLDHTALAPGAPQGRPNDRGPGGLDHTAFAPPGGYPGQSSPGGVPGFPGQSPPGGGPGYPGQASPGGPGYPGQASPGGPGYPGQATPGGPWSAPADPEHGRFEAFRPEAEPAAESKTEPPVPKVRNGRVLLAVLTAAVLILVVPFGTLWLLGKLGSDKPAFNPAIGSCVKQAGDKPEAADCAAPGAFKVISKVTDEKKCADAVQPHIVVPGSGGKTEVLCLQPATDKPAG